MSENVFHEIVEIKNWISGKLFSLMSEFKNQTGWKNSYIFFATSMQNFSSAWNLYERNPKRCNNNNA